MNCINYLEFAKKFKAFKIATARGMSLSRGQTSQNFIDNITVSLEKCRIFQIEDEVKKLLLLTTPPNLNDEVRMPFSHIFIDAEFTQDELRQLGINIKARKLTGILFTEGNLVLAKNGDLYDPSALSQGIIEQIDKKPTEAVVVGRALRMSIAYERDATDVGGQDNEIWFDTFNDNLNLFEGYEDMEYDKVTITDDKALRKMVHQFTINFLNFITQPDVINIEIQKSDKNNERRLKHGKIPIPTVHMIKVTGQTKRYIDEFRVRGHFHAKYTHRFWVRGHWKHFTSDRYKDMKGKRTWVLPFVKGSGMLIEKVYELKKEVDNNDKMQD
jgi:hypothetical protein